jgi:hypothetical protein
MNGERAASGRCAFPHSGQAHATSCVSCQDFGVIEAETIIHDQAFRLITVGRELDAHFGCLCMFNDVVQRLLHDAVKCNLYRRREAIDDGALAGNHDPVSFVVVMFLFAAIYKLLPDIYLKWSDVIVGACFTSLLFTIGKQLIGIYLGKASFGSTYRAAGSLVVVLMWVYYSAQLFFLGAEFTKVYTREFGSQFAATLQTLSVEPAGVIVDPSTGLPPGRTNPNNIVTLR